MRIPSFNIRLPHGKIQPPYNGAFFEQAGIHYDQHHNPILSLLTDDQIRKFEADAEKAEADRQKSKAAKPPAPQPVLDLPAPVATANDDVPRPSFTQEFGNAQRPAPEPVAIAPATLPIAPNADLASVSVDGDTIDLRAWALNGKKTAWSKVIKALDSLGVVSDTKQKAVAGMVADGIITQAELDAAVAAGVRW